MTGDSFVTWKEAPAHRKLPSHRNWRVGVPSCLMITFQRNDSQVLEKDIPGSKSWQEAFKQNLFKRFT